MVWTCAHTLCNNDGPSLGWIMGGGAYIYIHMCVWLYMIIYIYTITWQLIAKDLQNFISRSLEWCFEVRGFPTSWKGDLSCPWWLMMWHVEPDQTDSSVPTVLKTHVSTTFRYILEERWRFAALLHVNFRFDKSGIPFSRDTSLRLGPEIWRGWHGLTIKDTKCTIPVPSQSKLADVTISSAIVSVECMNDSIDISDPPTSNKTKCKKRNCCVPIYSFAIISYHHV